MHIFFTNSDTQMKSRYTYFVLKKIIMRNKRCFYPS